MNTENTVSDSDSPKTPVDQELETKLGLRDTRGDYRRLLRWLWIAILPLAVIVTFVVWSTGDNAVSSEFQTQPARRGGLTVIVSATGTIEPTNQVDVGSELSGTVESVEVDFNDRVKLGDVLARLNTDQVAARVAQSRAALEVALAKVQEVKATVLEMRLELDRCEELASRQLCAEAELNTAQAGYARATAQQQSAEALVSQAQATLDADESNLEKTVIHSPIDGIVLERGIEPGQTVAASLQTPLLFSLAEDLAQMELHVDIDEADVGQVQAGQTAIFTVDAYPNSTFPASISDVHYAPQTVAGVVTYEAILSVDNTDLLLRPGMTATADITVQILEGALLVPNAALRFSPPTFDEAISKSDDRGVLGAILPGRPRGSRQAGRPPASSITTEMQQVWMMRDGQPTAIPVTIGITDGVMTEIVAGDIEAGTPLLTNVVTSER